MIETPLIWNITNKCPYSCSFCCLDANSSIKDASLKDKLKIIENLDSPYLKIDVSGGEPLIDKEIFVILKKLSQKFGREKITITSTGKGLEKVNLTELEKYISEVGFTYDFPFEPSPNRPINYNQHNLELAREVSKQNIKTVAQTPLIKSNIIPEIMEKIYLNLKEAGINSLLLIKFSDSGRGNLWEDLDIAQEEINKAVKFYKRLESLYKVPKVKITPRIKGNLVGKILTSLNISNNGLLLSNPWNYDSLGRPKEKYILGSLIKENLSDLAGAKVYQRFLTQLRRNI